MVFYAFNFRERRQRRTGSRSPHRNSVTRSENYRNCDRLNCPETYKFYRPQYGFQRGIGIEAAILRAMDLQKSGHKYSVILDLKAAYGRVWRDKLINILRAGLPEDILRQTLPFLTVGWTSCVVSSSNSLAEITRGVPQGSPISPTLSNIFIDLLAERIEPNNGSAENTGIILFADDVQFTAKFWLALQQKPGNGVHVGHWNRNDIEHAETLHNRIGEWPYHAETLHNRIGEWPYSPENGCGTNPICEVGNLPRSHHNEARGYRQAPSRTRSEATGATENAEKPYVGSRNSSSWKTSRHERYVCMIKCESTNRNAIDWTTQCWKQHSR